MSVQANVSSYDGTLAWITQLTVSWLLTFLLSNVKETSWVDWGLIWPIYIYSVRYRLYSLAKVAYFDFRPKLAFHTINVTSTYHNHHHCPFKLYIPPNTVTPLLHFTFTPCTLPTQCCSCIFVSGRTLLYSHNNCPQFPPKINFGGPSYRLQASHVAYHVDWPSKTLLMVRPGPAGHRPASSHDNYCTVSTW